METWDDRKRERLRRYLVRTIGAASSIEDAANLIAENFESGVALGGTPDPFGPGGDPGARSPASRAPKSVCGACGALVTEDEEDQP